MKKYSVILLCFIILSCQKGVPEQSKNDQQANANTNNTLDDDLSIPQHDPRLAAMGPLDSIKDLDKTIESYKSGKNLTAEDEAYNRQLKKKVIRGTFDLYELCRLSLDKHWNEIDDKQRKYFSNLMTRLLETKAIFSKEQVKGNEKGYSVAYLSESFLDAEKKSSLVSTRISVPQEKLELNINYKLLATPHGWKIFDVIVDDASLVENYKFQFDTIITKYGYPELISRMEKKLHEMGSSVEKK